MLLLDTCALIWLSQGHDTFTDRARRAIEENAGALHVCAISAFEIALLSRKKRLRLPEPPDKWYTDVMSFHGLNELPVTGAIAARAAMLPRIHNDPCDRIILAAAKTHHLDIVTADTIIPTYPGITVVW